MAKRDLKKKGADNEMGSLKDHSEDWKFEKLLFAIFAKVLQRELGENVHSM